MKVMTFNIQHGNVNLKDYIDLAMMAEVIRSADPDVVALQEVFGKCPISGDTAQAEAIAAMLGMHAYFGRSIWYRGVNPYGNAVLSKYPILEAKVIDIPDPVGQKNVEHRTLTRAVIDAPEGRIAVYATHFGLSAPEHEHAVSTTLATLANEPLPFVLMGDLNMTPDNPLIAAMNGKLCGTDALLEGQLTFPSEAADRKIDYIFTSKTVRTTSAQVITKMASDHFPVTAEITY